MGYKTEQFVEKVDENFKCSICHDVLKDPWQCKNEHTFCKGCITRCLENREICPMDNDALRVGDLKPCLSIKNMIENLEVYCHPPESDGQAAANADAEESELKCDWTGKLQSLAEHKNKECPEEMLPCRNECISPETGQITKIKRKHLKAHMRDDCVKTILDCPFKDQGCSVQVERRHVDTHVQDHMAAHMMLLAEQCSSLAKENKQLKQELIQVKKKDELLRTYSWKIENYRNYLRPGKLPITSPTFWLCGYPWYLRLYLKKAALAVSLNLDEEFGSSRKKDGTYRGNYETPLSCRLSVASQRRDTEDYSLEERHVYRQTTGWSTSPLNCEVFIKADNEEYFDKDGNLIMKCTIQVDHE